MQRKKQTKRKKENILKKAVMKHRKVKAAIKRKQIRNVVKKINKPTQNCNLCHLKRCTSRLTDRLR